MHQNVAQALVESRPSHSKLLEYLEMEKKKVVAEAERLEALRSQQGRSLPGLGVLGTIPVADGVKKDLYKVYLLLREARKICQYFNKDVVSVLNSFDWLLVILCSASG